MPHDGVHNLIHKVHNVTARNTGFHTNCGAQSAKNGFMKQRTNINAGTGVSDYRPNTYSVGLPEEDMDGSPVSVHPKWIALELGFEALVRELMDQILWSRLGRRLLALWAQRELDLMPLTEADRTQPTPPTALPGPTSFPELMSRSVSDDSRIPLPPLVGIHDPRLIPTPEHWADLPPGDEPLDSGALEDPEEWLNCFREAVCEAVHIVRSRPPQPVCTLSGKRYTAIALFRLAF